MHAPEHTTTNTSCMQRECLHKIILKKSADGYSDKLNLETWKGSQLHLSSKPLNSSIHVR